MQTHPNTGPSPDPLHSRTRTPADVDILRLAMAAKRLQIGEATLRHLRYYADDRKAADGHVIPGNGFARAFLKLGRAVYVDVPVFVEIWRSQQPKGSSHV